MTHRVLQGDCREVMASMEASSVDAICTDPPYGISFMGKGWDHGVPGVEFWVEAFRVLKPGGHLLAFGGSRTYHRLACAIEDAGFEIRDSFLYWGYGTGFPKSLNVSKSERFCQCDQTEASGSERDMRDLREGVSLGSESHSASIDADVFTEMQRVSEGQGADTALKQGSSGLDRGLAQVVQGEDDRPEESVMEGWRDIQAPPRRLSSSEVREVPTGSTDYGAARRVRNGAQVGDGSTGGSSVGAEGSGASRGPQPAEQRSSQSGTLPNESGAQARRAWPTCAGCGKAVVPSGLGTALKPAYEPIIMARKPLVGTVTDNVLEHGTGALNIDGCRISAAGGSPSIGRRESAVRSNWDNRGGGIMNDRTDPERYKEARASEALGRWPANVLLTHSPDCVEVGTRKVKGGVIARPYVRANRNGYSGDMPEVATNVHYADENREETIPAYECVEDCPVRILDEQSGDSQSRIGKVCASVAPGGGWGMTATCAEYADAGGASRFFYCAKASRSERGAGNNHPTVKPIAVMQWLCRLVTPKGGVVLDPFVGSGSTGIAAIREGFQFIGIEKEAEYVAIAERRIAAAANAALLPMERVVIPSSTEVPSPQVVQWSFFDAPAN